MHKIAITGIIGSGKSTIGLMLIKNKIKFISADHLAKQAMAPNNLAYNPLLKLLGSQYLNDNKCFNTKKISKTIFNNPILLSKVESIIHPIVWKLIKNTESTLNKQHIVFYEIPLLFKVNWHCFFDTVVVTAINSLEQKKRLKQSRHLNSTDIKNRMQFQLSQKEQIKKAHYIIWNNTSLQDLEKQVICLIKDCTKRATIFNKTTSTKILNQLHN